MKSPEGNTMVPDLSAVRFDYQGTPYDAQETAPMDGRPVQLVQDVAMTIRDNVSRFTDQKDGNAFLYGLYNETKGVGDYNFVDVEDHGIGNLDFELLLEAPAKQMRPGPGEMSKDTL